MKRSATFIALVTVTTILVAGVRDAAPGADPNGLIAHEWGTFTTVAGADGRAVEWLPLGGPADLPCFVDRCTNRIKGSLRGKVRMETPVIYFYATSDVTANVRVTFPRGVITEWYPSATVQQPLVTASALRDGQRSTVEWRSVRVTPDAAESFPKESRDSHYYAARDTGAAPLQVGSQREKFLFYRGVGGFDVPLAAAALDDGAVRVTNLGTRDLRGVVLVENRAGRLGYRAHGLLRGEATIARPPAPVDPASLRAELERILVEAGLFPPEARAMVATWRDSWLEEGTRVFYVLAAADVDAILPLAIEPRPVQTARVFVGRMEVVTRDTLESARRAIAAGDGRALERHGRFLGAIADRLASQGTPREEAERIREITNAALAAHAVRSPACR